MSALEIPAWRLMSYCAMKGFLRMGCMAAIYTYQLWNMQTMRKCICNERRDYYKLYALYYIKDIYRYICTHNDIYLIYKHLSPVLHVFDLSRFLKIFFLTKSSIHFVEPVFFIVYFVDFFKVVMESWWSLWTTLGIS